MRRHRRHRSPHGRSRRALARLLRRSPVAVAGLVALAIAGFLLREGGRESRNTTAERAASQADRETRTGAPAPKRPRTLPARHLPIAAIQGRSHRSPFAGETVTTEGVVTGVRASALFIEDPKGDGDRATSEGIVVRAPAGTRAERGDRVRARGTVVEELPGGDESNLTTTALSDASVEILARGLELPAAVRIGAGGRLPPDEIIDDDAFALFDPETDGIDFWESLESMRVALDPAVAIAPGGGRQGIWVVLEGGARASGRNRRGGITAIPPDENPERIRLFALHPRGDATLPLVDLGDRLLGIEGIVGYAFGRFEILSTRPVENRPRTLEPEVTSLSQEAMRFRIASFNVLALDPEDGDGSRDVADGRYDATAAHIVTGLRAPAIIALQEIEDDSGTIDDGTTSAAKGLELLAARIREQGGPRYRSVSFDPKDGSSGGPPGSNIRVALLFDPLRAGLAPGSARRLGRDPRAFAHAREPLVARFEILGTEVTVIVLHLTSRGGSDPLFGSHQPPELAGVERRVRQARAVRRFVEELLAANESARIVVAGDLNDEPAGRALAELTRGASLSNLTELVPASERSTCIFEGNGRALDHILVSRSLRDGARYQIVHRAAGAVRGSSDHEPVIASLSVSMRDD